MMYKSESDHFPHNPPMYFTHDTLPGWVSFGQLRNLKAGEGVRLGFKTVTRIR